MLIPFTMFSSGSEIASIAFLLALSYPSTLSAALDSKQYTTPDGPWKHSEGGIASPYPRPQYDYKNCEHGPKSRACWGDLHVDTDMDLQWPTTGRTVRVRFSIRERYAKVADICSTILTSAM